MRILHLIIDHQVIERTLGIYEKVFPERNDVIIFNQGKSFKHLKKYADNLLVDRNNVDYTGQSFDFSLYDHIVAHFLTCDMIDFIKYAPQNIQVCWEIYGYDLYNQFLEPLGYRIQQLDEKKFLPIKFRILKTLRLDGLYLFLRTGRVSYFSYGKRYYFRKITSRINSVAVCCLGDARILEKYSKRNYIVYKAFNYSLHETLGDLLNVPFNQAKGIMIGNSASLSNNHLYVLDIIKNFNIGDVSIFMPLSYGGTHRYKETVMSKYKKCFPHQLNILLDYIPLHEYNKFFLNVGVMVLASWRQESIGTIFMGLYLGIKIYMSNKSPLYQSLKDEGFILYTIEETSETDFCTSLPPEQKEYNRTLLLDRYSDRAFEDELKRQFA